MLDEAIRTTVVSGDEVTCVPLKSTGVLQLAFHPDGRSIAVSIDNAVLLLGAPEWATKDEVPADAVAAEREIYRNSDELAGKPEQAIEKILDGMVQKRFFAAQPGGVLTEQPWIHDAAKTVGQALADGGASLLAFKRLSVAQ